MKKKYIVIAVMICLAVFAGIFVFGKKDKEGKEKVSGNKTETSITVDDTFDGVTDKEGVTEDNTSNDIDDIETWIEPAGGNTSTQNPTTDDDIDNNEKNTSTEDEEESSEGDENIEEKPEWIGGDF